MTQTVAAIKFRDEIEALRALPVLLKLDASAKVVSYTVQVTKPQYSPVSDSYGVALIQAGFPYIGYITIS